MFAAETTELGEFETIGVVLLVLHCVIIPLLAFAARESDFDSHFSAPPSKFRA